MNWQVCKPDVRTLDRVENGIPALETFGELETFERNA